MDRWTSGPSLVRSGEPMLVQTWWSGLVGPRGSGVTRTDVAGQAPPGWVGPVRLWGVPESRTSRDLTLTGRTGTGTGNQAARGKGRRKRWRRLRRRTADMAVEGGNGGGRWKRRQRWRRRTDDGQGREDVGWKTLAVDGCCRSGGGRRRRSWTVDGERRTADDGLRTVIGGWRMVDREEMVAA